MALSNLFKRNSVYVGTIFVGAYLFAIGFDSTTTRFFEYMNRGKLWKDVRHKYVQNEES